MTRIKSSRRVSSSDIGKATQKNRDYSRFEQIDGLHPLQLEVPESCVLYKARQRPGGRVAYFNFDLAKEMGLIASDHPAQLPEELSQKIIDTFGLRIINEFDIMNSKKFPEAKIKPNYYMATRYLQLQHPSKTGKTSGDGRSIWNGTYKSKSKRWDISSCGTGATRLSPATAIKKRFFESGDPSVSYGCGLADLEDGLAAAIMSEIFHQSGVPTERTLALIEYSNGLSINIRASENLLRPSHFFVYLKQKNLEKLLAIVDYHIGRMLENGTWPKIRTRKKRYDHFLSETIKSFARASAIFESDYIFCWLDWDGDNILMDGGIIDYGSVRQFGLFHKEYRYDDVDRWSTTISEQKAKARYIVQTFVQLVDFIQTEKYKNIKSFDKSDRLKQYDDEFENTLDQQMIRKIGFRPQDQKVLLGKHAKLVRKFRKTFQYFERIQSKKGVYKVTDGVTSDAVFCMPDFLREYPRLLYNGKAVDNKKIVEIIASSYARESDLKLTFHRKTKLKKLKSTYDALLEIVSTTRSSSRKKVLLEVMLASSVINPLHRITGDAVMAVTKRAIRDRKKMDYSKFYELVSKFVRHQNTAEESPLKGRKKHPCLVEWTELVSQHKEGI